MAKIVATVTCDIQNSSKYSVIDRNEINRILLEKIQSVHKLYRKEIQTLASFSIIKGDEFQFVINNPKRAYEIVVFFRILIGLEPLKPLVTFRTSIGIGEIAVETGESSYSQDGEAFHLSRFGMEDFISNKGMRKRRSIIRTNNKKLNEKLNIILMYQDLIESRWTLGQMEAIRWRMEMLPYKKIAQTVGVAWQNIQKRLKAAYWSQYYFGLKFLEKLIEIHLSKGET
jgi:hypothetical protein